MKKLTLFFACIALATSFNCSQAMAGWAFSVSGGNVFASGGGTVNAEILDQGVQSLAVFAERTGAAAPSVDLDFISPSPVVTPVGTSNIAFASGAVGSVTNVAVGDVVNIGSLSFDGDPAVFGDTGLFDVALQFVAFETGTTTFFESGTETFQLSLTAVPEPTTLCMFGVGMVGLVARRRRN